jgi:hypothetical protein
MNLRGKNHELNNLEHGEETQNTYYMHYHEKKPSHIDYCFMPKSWANKKPIFNIGDYDTWVRAKLSDHSPICLELL